MEREKGREVYGARKVWLELNRQGVVVARCTVERLMRELGIGGARARRKRPRTTVPGGSAGYPADLPERCFDAPAPNRRWVADITYVDTFSGWVYTAFVMDLFARRDRQYGYACIRCGRRTCGAYQVIRIDRPTGVAEPSVEAAATRSHADIVWREPQIARLTRCPVDDLLPNVLI